MIGGKKTRRWTHRVDSNPQECFNWGGNWEPVPTGTIGIVQQPCDRFLITILLFKSTAAHRLALHRVTSCHIMSRHVAVRLGRCDARLLQPGGNMEQRLHTAVCNQCNAVISRRGANTSNMQKHLSTRHGIKFQGCLTVSGLVLLTLLPQRSTLISILDGNIHIK